MDGVDGQVAIPLRLMEPGKITPKDLERAGRKA
jgi:hypothetical protein